MADGFPTLRGFVEFLRAGQVQGAHCKKCAEDLLVVHRLQIAAGFYFLIREFVRLLVVFVIRLGNESFACRIHVEMICSFLVAQIKIFLG